MSLVKTNICVSGPYDGRILEHIGPVFRVAICKSVPGLRDPEPSLAKLDTDTVAYRREFVRFETGEVFQIWLPEGVTPAQAFEHLLRRLAGISEASYDPQNQTGG